jgi:amino acid transporter
VQRGEKELSLAGLATVMFFIVCGGTYGLEEAVSEAGAWWTVVLVIAIPFVWSIPVSLMVAELSALMPKEGGYYGTPGVPVVTPVASPGSYVRKR